MSAKPGCGCERNRRCLTWLVAAVGTVAVVVIDGAPGNALAACQTAPRCAVRGLRVEGSVCGTASAEVPSCPRCLPRTLGSDAAGPPRAARRRAASERGGRDGARDKGDELRLAAEQASWRPRGGTAHGRVRGEGAQVRKGAGGEGGSSGGRSGKPRRRTDRPSHARLARAPHIKSRRLQRRRAPRVGAPRRCPPGAPACTPATTLQLAVTYDTQGLVKTAGARAVLAPSPMGFAAPLPGKEGPRWCGVCSVCV
jgi:hypothetical protein